MSAARRERTGPGSRTARGYLEAADAWLGVAVAAWERAMLCRERAGVETTRDHERAARELAADRAQTRLELRIRQALADERGAES